MSRLQYWSELSGHLSSYCLSPLVAAEDCCGIWGDKGLSGVAQGCKTICLIHQLHHKALMFKNSSPPGYFPSVVWVAMWEVSCPVWSFTSPLALASHSHNQHSLSATTGAPHSDWEIYLTLHLNYQGGDMIYIQSGISGTQFADFERLRLTLGKLMPRLSLSKLSKLLITEVC